MNRATILIAALLLTDSFARAALSVRELRCEYRTDPLGVDVDRPRLSWILHSDQNGQVQTGYQILVASTPSALAENRGDLWDSGRVESDQTLQIRYAGEPLRPGRQAFWKVRTWDGQNQPSEWSQAANWTMGLLGDSDWSAKWIGTDLDPQPASLLLRRHFDVKPQLRRAVVFVCGLGQYEMLLNGKKVGEDLLTPGWTKYDKTCLYDTYDVTRVLHPGANAIGLLLGNGMYHVAGGRYTKFKGSFGPQKAIAQLRLEYEDGSIQTVGTDEQWKVHPGPITFSCVYGGEDFDARLEQPGWAESGFANESSWSPARVVAGPGGKLRGLSAAAPPIRIVETLKPVNIRELRPAVSVYDLGQNASMMIRLKVRGPAGSSVRITSAELLRPDGSVNRSSVGGGQAYWQYTLAGIGIEDWTTRFFYHGCRYLQVETTADVSIDSLDGLVVHSTAEPIGEFSCSNVLFNRIRTLVRWAQRSNMASVLSDCPHRERLGWLEQNYLNGPSLRYEFDLASFFAKVMNDMADSQLDDGLVPAIAPEYTVFKGGFRDSPEWGSAFIQCAWQQYEWTGDSEPLARHYEGMKRYLMYLDSKSTMGIVNHGLGDWYDLGPKRPGSVQLTPVGVTATATFYDDIRIMEKAARLLGKPGDVEEFAKLASQVRGEYIRSYFDDSKQQYATGSQTANAISLALGLVEPQHAAPVLEAIVADVRSRGNSLTAGDIGYRYLLRALAAGGRSDVIFDMNNQSERPGYGYQLQRGATSLTEGWGGSGSQNHFMLGHIMEWFYHDLAGIQPDPEGPGFKRIIIKPTVVGDLTWVKARYKSLRGPIVSEWSRDGGKFTLRVSIPPNTTATVHVPSKSGPIVRQITSGEHSLDSELPE